MFCADDIHWVDIPAGSTLLGTLDADLERLTSYWKRRLVISGCTEAEVSSWFRKEAPRRRVDVPAFRISKYPITRNQFFEFRDEIYGEVVPEDRAIDPDHPITGVSLAEAIEFCDWYSSVSGTETRLPSEVEWEYAARGPTSREYPYGDEFDKECANTAESEIKHTTSVHAYESYPSYFGLCDMAGNVEEWTSSNYSTYPGGQLVIDDLWREFGGTYPILRGGSYALGADLSRCSRRHGPSQSIRSLIVTGFRPAQSCPA